MGLDSFFRMSCAPGECAPSIRIYPRPNLVGGVLSGDGNDGSFRGKVYAEDIERISGISLYQEHMCNEDVLNIADALEAWLLEPDVEGLRVPLHDIKDLARVFRAYGNSGYYLMGWW